MSFGADSRYLLTSVVNVVSPVTGELTRPPFVDLRDRVSSTASDDRSIIWDTVDPWASIALQQLFSANAWWVIADMSNIVDPFTELVEGVQLRVPSLSRFQLDILPSDLGSFQ